MKTIGDIDTAMKAVKSQKQQKKSKTKVKRGEQAKAGALSAHLDRMRAKVFELQDRVDKKTMSPAMYKLKHKQLATLNSLKSIAVTVGISYEDLENISKAAETSSVAALVCVSFLLLV